MSAIFRFGMRVIKAPHSDKLLAVLHFNRLYSTLNTRLRHQLSCYEHLIWAWWRPRSSTTNKSSRIDWYWRCL